MKQVQVLPHDPAWRALFEVEASLIADALGENMAAIHHIGSMSIPDIYAKPIIDLLVEVNDMSMVDERTNAMEALGYEAKSEFGIPGRRYFRKDNEAGIRTHHVHTFQTGSDEIRRHLAFRDYMIAHPEDALAYSDLKRQLALENVSSSENYTTVKIRL